MQRTFSDERAPPPHHNSPRPIRPRPEARADGERGACSQATASTLSHNRSWAQSGSPGSVSPSLRRMRGDDGRFVQQGDDDTLAAPPRDLKVCGWCRTTSTPQWRIGSTSGSPGKPLYPSPLLPQTLARARVQRLTR